MGWLRFLATQKSKWDRQGPISDLSRSEDLQSLWKTQLHWLCPDSMKEEEVEEEEDDVGTAPE